MKICEISDELEISGGPFPGVYKKRRGSRTDNTLYCWFDQALRSGVPHISLHHTYGHNEELTHFHVTFPVLKLITTPSSGSWLVKSETIEKVEESRYHVYLTIDERDKCVITNTDETWLWKRVPAEERNVKLSFNEMNRKAQQFGDWFYAAAATTFPNR